MSAYCPTCDRSPCICAEQRAEECNETALMAVGSTRLLGHVELDARLLQFLGLSEESSKLVMDHITELRAEIKVIKRRTLLEASSEVAGHWNDRTTMTNQYEQAQRSAGVLQRMGYAIECPNEKGQR